MLDEEIQGGKKYYHPKKRLLCSTLFERRKDDTNV